MKTVWVTGGSGFFGRILKSRLLALGVQCVNVDLHPDPDEDPMLDSYQGDLRNQNLMEEIASKYRFDTVFHCASLLAHGVSPGTEGNNKSGPQIQLALTRLQNLPNIMELRTFFICLLISCGEKILIAQI